MKTEEDHRAHKAQGIQGSKEPEWRFNRASRLSKKDVRSKKKAHELKEMVL